MLQSAQCPPVSSLRSLCMLVWFHNHPASAQSRVDIPECPSLSLPGQSSEMHYLPASFPHGNSVSELHGCPVPVPAPDTRFRVHYAAKGSRILFQYMIIIGMVRLYLQIVFRLQIGHICKRPRYPDSIPVIPANIFS